MEPARPVPDDWRTRARQDLETYIDIMIHHDPAMKNALMCFGKKGGFRWAMNLFYDR